MKLTDMSADIQQEIDAALKAGMKPPLIVAVFSPRGDIAVGRFVSGTDLEELVSHIAGPRPADYSMPIRVLIVDQEGRST
jgi:hypothetical protein